MADFDRCRGRATAAPAAPGGLAAEPAKDALGHRAHALGGIKTCVPGVREEPEGEARRARDPRFGP